jgi:hypothetical protein
MYLFYNYALLVYEATSNYQNLTFGEHMLLNKIFLKLVIICIISWIPISSGIAGITAEDVFFSKLTTVKTWVADKYQKDSSLLNLITSYVGYLVFENTDAFDMQHMLVPQDKDTKRDYGKLFHTLPDIELPFLQHVKNTSQKKKHIITLEIAAGAGFVSWKVPLAFEKNGHHYANDLSSVVINSWLVPIITKRYQQLSKPELSNLVTAITGSCFEILDKHPELVNKVDVIYVQNLEHFFNPKQHQKFLKLIETLLAPGGRAFLCAHSTQQVYTEAFHKLFLEREAKGEVYPGFVQYDVTFMQQGASTALINPETYNPVIPANYDIECSKKTLSTYKKGDYTYATQRLVDNLFTPQIYRKAIENSTNLLLVDSFYMDIAGNRQTIDDENEESTFAVAIVKKPEVKQDVTLSCEDT